jgi:hypothetical protein
MGAARRKLVAMTVLLLASACHATRGASGDRVGLAAAPRSDTPAPPDRLTPLAGVVLETPSPVTGADGRQHVAYELALTSPFSLRVTVESIQTLDADGNVVETLEGAAIPELLTIFGGTTGTTFGPGQGGVVIMDATADGGATVARALTHRITVSLETAPGVPFDNSRGALATTFEAGATRVGRQRPVVVAPPLRGARWWDAVGCCARSAHRGAVLPVNGAFHVAERYAIDFVQLDEQGRFFNGPKDQLSSYAYYGTPVHAVADGKVVNLLDGLLEQTPGKLPAAITAATAGGNYVVQEIGSGAYAFYAHLQPGSQRFRIGDSVQSGEVLGLLGNTGNTDAPHLHFHVMDGPEPLSSRGIPYVFASYDVEGVVTNPAQAADGAPAVVDRSRLVGAQRRTLPLDQQLLTFAAD